MAKKLARLGVGMVEGYLLTLAFMLSIKYLITLLSPYSFRFDYDKVEPAQEVFCVGERPRFVSYSHVKRVPIYIVWNDTQLCDIDSRTDDDYGAYYNNALTSVYATTPYNRLLTGRMRHYNDQGLTEPGTCRMQHEITIATDFGVKETQVLVGKEYRYEYCNTSTTGRLVE